MSFPASHANERRPRSLSDSGVGAAHAGFAGGAPPTRERAARPGSAPPGRGPVMRTSRHKPTIGFGSVAQIAIVVGGVVAVGLLVAAHPAIGIALVVGVLVLALLFGRAPHATKDEPAAPGVGAPRQDWSDAGVPERCNDRSRPGLAPRLRAVLSPRARRVFRELRVAPRPSATALGRVRPHGCVGRPVATHG